MKLVLLAVLSLTILAGCTNNQGSSIGTMEEPSRDETHEARPVDPATDDNKNKQNGQPEQTDSVPLE